MNKIDEALLKAQFKANSIINPNNEKTVKRAKFIRTGIIVANVMVVMFALATMAFADDSSAGETIAKNVGAGLKDVYGVVTAIAVPVAVIAVAFAIFQFIFGGEKGVQVAKKTLIYVGIGLAGIYLAPLIISAVSDWFKDSASNGGSVWTPSSALNNS